MLFQILKNFWKNIYNQTMRIYKNKYLKNQKHQKNFNIVD